MGLGVRRTSLAARCVIVENSAPRDGIEAPGTGFELHSQFSNRHAAQQHAGTYSRSFIRPVLTKKIVKAMEDL